MERLRCDPCARRSYERSDHFRGLPIYPPTFTVVPIDSDVPLGVFDDENGRCRLARRSRSSPGDQVEVLVDRSPMHSMTGWE